jgi:ribose transport system permease protein
MKKDSVLKKLMARREFNILALVIIVLVIMSVASPYFFTVTNFTTVGIGLAIDGLLVIGMAMVLATGGVDLSIGSVLALTSMLTAVFHIQLGLNIWLSCIIAIVIGGLLGAINGFMIGKVGITPLIVTLAMMGMARGMTYVVTKGATVAVSSAPKAFIALGGGDVMGVPILIVIFLVFVVVFDLMMRNMLPFRKMYYTGSNEKATMLSGIDVIKTKIFTYIMSGLFCGLSGVLTLSRFTVATPNSGIGAEMRIISACVIGGASLSGGVGTVIGSVLGLVLLSIINNGLILMDVSIYWQSFISGAILLLAVTIDKLNTKEK